MKNSFLLLLSLSAFVGCSQVQETKRYPASIQDVGVIGPDGEVLLYYKEGEHIVVKACEPSTVLGMTPAQARSNCQGKMNKVPVDAFKQSLHSLVLTSNLFSLSPLTKEEVEAYRRGGPALEKIEAMGKELEKINAFIAAYGEENANLIKRDELIKSLRSQESRIRAFLKISSEVEKTVDLIVNNSKLTLTKMSSDKGQFLYSVLKQFNPNQIFPCGLKGSLEERIRDCSYQLTSEKENFVLVTRSTDFKEIYKDLSTGLLWSLLPNLMNLSDARLACLAFTGNLPEISWRLPSIRQHFEATKNGIRKLPNMSKFFWSSDVDISNSQLGSVFSGTHDYADISYYYAVRCVGTSYAK